MDTDENLSSEMIYGLAVAAPGDVFLATSEGLMHSRDQGRSWVDGYGALFGGQPMPTTCLTYNEKEQVLFTGVPGGIARSRDHGATWQVIRLQEPAPLPVALAFSPAYGQDHTLFAATVEDGVFCSLDDGETWQAWNFGLLDANLFALAVSPNYARNRTLYSASSTGIFRSGNGGYSWLPIAGPDGEEGAHCLLDLDAGENGNVLLAVFEQSGLFSSRDSGGSWIRADGLPAEVPVSQLVSHPSLPGRVDCLAAGQVYRSEDYGENFTPLAVNGVQALFIHITPGLGSCLWMAGEGRELRMLR